MNTFTSWILITKHWMSTYLQMIEQTGKLSLINSDGGTSHINQYGQIPTWHHTLKLSSKWITGICAIIKSFLWTKYCTQQHVVVRILLEENKDCIFMVLKQESFLRREKRKTETIGITFTSVKLVILFRKIHHEHEHMWQMRRLSCVLVTQDPHKEVQYIRKKKKGKFNKKMSKHDQVLPTRESMKGIITVNWDRQSSTLVIH